MKLYCWKLEADPVIYYIIVFISRNNIARCRDLLSDMVYTVCLCLVPANGKQ